MYYYTPTITLLGENMPLDRPANLIRVEDLTFRSYTKLGRDI